MPEPYRQETVSNKGLPEAEGSRDLVGDLLDDLLEDSVVYVPDAEPVEAQPQGHDAEPQEGETHQPPSGPISPLYWAAAIVWGLPVGVLCWYLLRDTRPREAKALLWVGLISSAVLTTVVIGTLVLQQTLAPSSVYIRLH